MDARRLDALARLADARGVAGSANPFRNARLAVEADAVADRTLPDDPDALRRMAAEAERKAEQAAADREDKRVPYESDPLFMYLWRRRYGTPAYDKVGFVKRMDGFVARHIGYERARANYHTLMALPDRLAEHAERLRARADALAPGEDLEARAQALIADARRDPTPETAAILDELEALPSLPSEVTRPR